MVTNTKTQQRKKDSERLRGEGDQIKFIDLGFERWQVVESRKGERDYKDGNARQGFLFLIRELLIF